MRETLERLRAEAAGTWQPQEAPSARQLAEQDLATWGFAEKYYTRVRVDQGLRSTMAEDALQKWLEALGAHLQKGSWLVLTGSVGVGKSMAMARIALGLRRFAPGTWGQWDYAAEPVVCRQVPRPWLTGEVLYLLAPDLGAIFTAADRYSQTGEHEGQVSMATVRAARVLFVDDLDRWFGMTDFDRDLGRWLMHWDTLCEQRDGPGRVTVVSANLSEEEMRENKPFARFVDRARGNGLVLTVPGGSQRGASDAG